MQYIWQNGAIVRYEDATTHVMSHALHYGTGVFEGIRVYSNNNTPKVLALSEHVDRFLHSANSLEMQIPYTHEELCTAITKTVKLNGYDECYIRPLAYYGMPKSSGVRIMPSTDTPVEVIIACYKMGNYLPDMPIHVKISDLIRIHPKSTNVEAKICGHYVNSLQALFAIRNTHYSEVIMLDYEGNVSEGSSDNVFMVKNGVIYTPLLGGILNGITRKTIISISYDLGLQVVENLIKPAELFEADEVFIVGTAVEVRGVASINDLPIGNGNCGEITQRISKEYKNICKGSNLKYQFMLTPCI